MLKTDKALSKEEIAKSFVYTAIDKNKTEDLLESSK